MICIQTAFKKETDIITQHFKATLLCKKPYKTYSTKINRKNIIIFQSGVGKTESSAGAQYACSVFKPHCIINAGVCGSLKNNIKIGDMIFAAETEEHDYIFDKPITVWNQNVCLLKIIKKNIPSLHFEKIISADRNVEQRVFRNELVKKYNAGAADWESAAISRTCKKNNTLCVILRAASDMADEDFESDFMRNTVSGMKNICAILPEIIDHCYHFSLK